ncbi:hypothetical protein AUK05_01655 [Candidatus Shapirobacteria bacterium CG2_30_35_20]|uniref:Bro-N domain-containing protein n=3 Tax=Candidatus Shapironibacteriota TaxID=1752721 RepID=A0A1J5I7S5_9BACT|nr:MAG: hypothetical protein AUK05_01655 [Candidatus Shapirobacteria bacterium CG2_30_35_20]
MNKIKSNSQPVIFQESKIRRHWDGENELWYFSIIDIIKILTDSNTPKRYWSDLKNKLKNEGSEVYDKIVHLKLVAIDGKKYLTDCFSTENMFRVIQSIPSPKAEPFKLWLAKVGYQRIEEIDDPELAISRAMKTYLRKGCSKEWINQRLKSIEIRKELTDEWEKRGVKEGREFAILTNEITKAWTDMDVRSYKNLKGLKKENLRDNMTNLELVLNMLAEASTTEISNSKRPNNWVQNVDVVKKGGGVARKARNEIEKNTGKSVITSKNANNLRLK